MVSKTLLVEYSSSERFWKVPEGFFLFVTALNSEYLTAFVNNLDLLFPKMLLLSAEPMAFLGTCKREAPFWFVTYFPLWVF